MYKKYVINGTGSVSTPVFKTKEKTMHKTKASNYETNAYGDSPTQKQIDGITYYSFDNEIWYKTRESTTPSYHSGSSWITYSDPYKYYDTGGYTGAWGPEGKLAVLHEKELILNKHDTENFLTATNILREISDMLDNNALTASLGAINLSAMNINSPAD